jgi:lysozyme-like protein
MAAIAIRESGGDPSAHNLNPKTGDDSYGLVQINWAPAAGLQPFLKANGISDPTALLEPATNARAAFLLWRGKNAYLDLLWYIRHVGTAYQQKYQENLLLVHEAVLAAVTPPQPAT